MEDELPPQEETDEQVVDALADLLHDPFSGEFWPDPFDLFEMHAFLLRNPPTFTKRRASDANRAAAIEKAVEKARLAIKQRRTHAAIRHTITATNLTLLSAVTLRLLPEKIKADQRRSEQIERARRGGFARAVVKQAQHARWTNRALELVRAKDRERARWTITAIARQITKEENARPERKGKRPIPEKTVAGVIGPHLRSLRALRS